MFYAVDIFINESFLKPLHKNAKLDKSFIQSIPSANVSPDISTFKDHRTQQQGAQQVVENTGKLGTCKTSIFHTNKRINGNVCLLFERLIREQLLTTQWIVIIWQQM